MNNPSVHNGARLTVTGPISVISSHGEESGMVALLHHNKSDRRFVPGVQGRTSGCTSETKESVRKPKLRHT